MALSKATGLDHANWANHSPVETLLVPARLSLNESLEEYVERAREVMPSTPVEKIARQWRAQGRYFARQKGPSNASLH